MADNEKLERLLDKLQSVTARKVELFAKAQKLQSMIDLMDKKQELLRNDIMSLFKQDVVEEPSPNADPEEVPPVTDMEEVKKLVPVLKSAIGVAMRNRMTGEEREFKSKNQAAKFLNVSYPKMNDIIAKGGMYGDWNVTLNVHGADSPTA